MAKTNIIISALNPELFSVKRLMSEAIKLKHSVSYLNPYQFQIPLKEKKLNGRYFHRTTGTNYDDFDLLVTKHHELQGMQITNPISNLITFRAKDSQALFFKEHKIPSIPSLLYRGRADDKIKEAISSLTVSLNLPDKFILKMNRGNQGIGVNFIEGTKSLFSILETFHAMKDQRFLIQPYILHKKEWRLLIIKGEIIACIEKSISKEDFRGNSKRSTGKCLTKIPLNLQKIALHAFKSSGLDYAGIDILESHKGELMALEINPIPGFEQAEELSGINVATLLLR